MRKRRSILLFVSLGFLLGLSSCSRKSPKALSADGLDPDDEYFIFSLADRIAEHVRIEDDAASVDRLKELPQRWRYIEPIVYYYNEVNNGGHHQYFWNSHGAFRGLVREGLDYYGASAHLKVFDEALAAYDPKMYEVESGATWERFQAAYKDRRFDKQDDEFFGIKPDLAAVLTSAVKKGLAEKK